MDAATLARALGGKKSGRQFLACCPAHPDNKPSLMIFDGHSAVQLRCQAGCEPRAVIAALRARKLWDGTGGQPESDEAYQRRMAERAKHDAIEHARRVRQAMNVWNDARPATGTIVERMYFNYWRGLDRARIKRLFTDVIRYHHRCPHDNERRPAMLALM